MAATTTTVHSAGPVTGSRSFLDRLRDGDEIARLVTFVFAGVTVLITLLLVFELWRGSVLPRHKFGFGFFFTRVWDPNAGDFGALPFIYGTLVTAAVSLVIAVPLGIGAAIFLAELAPARVSDTLQFFIDLLAAVPSVIYGLLGVFIIIPMMRPVFLSAIIILTHLAIKSYDLVLSVTGKNPGGAAELPSTFMYSFTFTRNQMAVGSTSAVIMLMTIAAIMVPYLYSELRQKRS